MNSIALRQASDEVVIPETKLGMHRLMQLRQSPAQPLVVPRVGAFALHVIHQEESLTVGRIHQVHARHRDGPRIFYSL